MNKLAKEFGAGESSFLAFEVPGIPISPRELDFNQTNNPSALTPQAAIKAAASFAQLVNRIPKVSSRWQSDGKYLWNEYETILKQATVATNETTAEDLANFEQSTKFLYEKKQITDLLGTRTAVVDSPKLAAYKQYREAYQQAESNFNSLKQAAQTTTDPIVVQQWATNASRYKRQVTNANEQWINSGFKNDVEKALATIDQICGRNPRLCWSKWTEEFELSKLTDSEQKNFYHTYFSPVNFYQPGGEKHWQQFTLNSSDIETLSKSDSPASDTQEAKLEISRLTVDLTRVQIVRPWMNPSIFESQFWTWTDNRPPLSDGGQPPQGSLPAYTTAIILARNLKIELQPGSEQNAKVVQDIAGGKSVFWGSFSLQNATVSGANSIQFEGMQIIAFVCQKLPKSPNPNPSWSLPSPEVKPTPTPEPTPSYVVNWFSGEYRLDPQAKITQIKVTIGTGGDFRAGTDANIQLRINDVEIRVNTPVELRINNSDWLAFSKPHLNTSESSNTATYGPFDTKNLTVENLSGVPIEFQPDTILRLWASQVQWLRLEVNVEGHGWLAYKQWQPGWLDATAKTNYRQLQ